MIPTRRRFAAILVFGSILGGGLSLRCWEPDPCVGPGSSIDTSTDSPEGQLPSWAVGRFGYHEVDVANYWIESDGTAFSIFDGGDAVAGCAAHTASFVDGWVHLLSATQTIEDPHEVIVRTTDGRIFLGDSDSTDLTCGWHELEPTNLCGRQPGGCGGYASTVPCGWNELPASDRCPDPDAGSGEADGGDAE
jgi:hypothetical protein